MTFPFEGDFPWISLTYGQLPPYEEVLRRVGAGETYPMELVPHDVDAIENCLESLEMRHPNAPGFEEFPARHGKTGYRFTAQGLYALISCIVTLWDEEQGFDDAEGIDWSDRPAMNLASSILYTLNIEWV